MKIVAALVLCSVFVACHTTSTTTVGETVTGSSAADTGASVTGSTGVTGSTTPSSSSAVMSNIFLFGLMSAFVALQNSL